MRKKFMSFLEFESVYGDKVLNTIMSKKSLGKIPLYVFKKEGKYFKFLDINFFVRRKDFARKVWLDSHDNYYFITKYLNSYQLCYLLNKIDSSISVNVWNSFINLDLFLNGEQGFSDYKIRRTRWAFYRYTRWLIRGFFIIAKVKPQHRDISVLLDKY